jgi:metacaspase-1
MAKGIAVNVGLNRVDGSHYGGWNGPLTACEADARAMAGIARAEGYDTHLLLTAQATRAAVLESLDRAAQVLTSGDILLLTYSGHGGQLPDVNGDEADLQDETWCLYDGELVDDELGVAWSAFAAGVRILVLSDSCHSGTVTRLAYDELARTGAARRPVPPSGGAAALYRAMPEDVARRTYRQNRDVYRRIAAALPAALPPITCAVRLISGCQDNQLSLDGTFNGLFTATLLRVWKDGAFRGDYYRFHRDIVRRMPPTQSPNHFVTGVPNDAFDRERPFTI